MWGFRGFGALSLRFLLILGVAARTPLYARAVVCTPGDTFSSIAEYGGGLGDWTFYEGSSTNADQTYVSVGAGYPSVGTGPTWVAFRFRNIPLKVGDIVTEARVRLANRNDNSGISPFPVAMYVQDSLTPGGEANLNLDQRTYLSVTQTWNPSGPFGADQYQFTANFANVLNAWTALPGFDGSGTADVLVVLRNPSGAPTPSQGYDFRSIEYSGGSLKPRLYLTYFCPVPTTGTTGTTAPSASTITTTTASTTTTTTTILTNSPGTTSTSSSSPSSTSGLTSAAATASTSTGSSAGSPTESSGSSGTPPNPSPRSGEGVREDSSADEFPVLIIVFIAVGAIILLCCALGGFFAYKKSQSDKDEASQGHLGEPSEDSDRESTFNRQSTGEDPQILPYATVPEFTTLSGVTPTDSALRTPPSNGFKSPELGHYALVPDIARSAGVSPQGSPFNQGTPPMHPTINPSALPSHQRDGNDVYGEMRNSWQKY